MALPNITWVNSSFNNSGFVNDVAKVGSNTYSCVYDEFSFDAGMLSFLNMVTLGVMLYLHRKGKIELHDRGVNILFLVNVFAFFGNLFILLGFKFFPARG